VQQYNFTALVVNAGSSSLKLAAFDADDRLLADVHIAGLGQTDSTYTLHQIDTDPITHKLGAENHAQAFLVALNELQKLGSVQNCTAVGHRIVYGGHRHVQPAVIDDALLRDLTDLQPYDPDHLPTALQLIRTAQKYLPHATHIACFDTAFYQAMPAVAQRLPLPRRFQQDGLRRYGFHGLSYESLVKSFREVAGDAAVNGRVIYAHLGSGVSLTATNQGQPVDTTMGFSPSSGVMMSTRSGDIDPGIMQYMHTKHVMDMDQVMRMVNAESGLLGVSGLSADMYTLLQREADHTGAAEAIELFVYQVRKAIGSLAATMNGLDSLIFAGGIGEQSAAIRARICDGLQFLGVQLDDERNEQQQRQISADSSTVGVHVLRSNEAVAMYDMVRQLVRGVGHD
jgi:acetate kinase